MKRHPWHLLPGLLIAAFAAATCGSGPDSWDGDYEVDPLCRTQPFECDGDIGGRCAFEDDCDEGVCCLTGHCGGGMCTYLCGGGTACPFGMRCHDGFCFFACSNDGECAAGQRCEVDNTICRYRD